MYTTKQSLVGIVVIREVLGEVITVLSVGKKHSRDVKRDSKVIFK